MSNLALVETEIRELYQGYETALVTNDAATLVDYFWKSSKTVRYGATENLYGSEEIVAFRQGRPSAGLARDVTRCEVVALDAVTGYVNIEFERRVNGQIKYGRQSQFWRKFDEIGWKVVSAHVSFLPK